MASVSAACEVPAESGLGGARGAARQAGNLSVVKRPDQVRLQGRTLRPASHVRPSFRPPVGRRSRQERASCFWGTSEAHIISSRRWAGQRGANQSPHAPSGPPCFIDTSVFWPTLWPQVPVPRFATENVPLPINVIQATPRDPGPQRLDRIRPAGRENADASRERSWAGRGGGRGAVGWVWEHRAPGRWGGWSHGPRGEGRGGEGAKGGACRLEMASAREPRNNQG